MVSLFMALILLIMVTAITLYTSRTVLVEQKLSGNDFRSRQALEAAESGIAAALAYLNHGWDRDGDGSVDAVYDTSEPPDGVGDDNTTTFADGSSVTIDSVTGTHPDYRIQATGRSDDRSASRTITVGTAIPDALPNRPDNPLITQMTIDVTGSATVHNPEGSSTIWSGADVALGSNNATATEVADPGDANFPGCMDTTLSDPKPGEPEPDPPLCNLVKSSDKINVGLDVIEHDFNLSNLTPEEVFRNFFGVSMEQYVKKSMTLRVSPENIYESADNDPPGAELATNEVIFVDGDLDLSGGNLTIGCAAKTTGNQLCEGADIQPCIVIVDGDAIIGGTPNITGLLYVHGNVTVTGNLTNMGATIVAGELTSSTGGSFDIWYNSDVLGQVSGLGNLTTLPGGWRDW
jgi:hypothetical protein